MSKQGTRRNTSALIASELTREAKPLSAYELLERLRPSGVFAPTTIYRALDKLLAAGTVHRIESLNAFVACPRESAHEHAHEQLGFGFTICDRCASVSEFEDLSLRTRIETAAAASAFLPKSSIVEIHGLCAACASELNS